MSSSFLPFHQPDIGEAEIESVVETLRSGWLTTGPKAKRLESDFARYLGVRHAIAVNSCTAALHLALEAVGVREGDEVILPTMTFAASAEVVLYLKAKPVLVDCRADTLNIDAEKIAQAITKRTKAIMPVHFGGQPCDMNEIMEIARRHDLKVVEDAAHALPAQYQGKWIGAIGDATCFSFYATKTITTGEGGMVTTGNDEVAERMRMMSLHGISHDAWKRYTKEGSWYYEILSPGFKYNLTDIAAAIGIEQLKKCDELWEARQRIAMIYRNAFAKLEEIRFLAYRKDVQHAWHLFVIQLNLESLKIDRNRFIESLREKEIGASVHFIPLHFHPYYRDNFGYQRQEFPNASAAFERIISLPVYSKMTEADVERVIVAVKTIVRDYRR
ncbi:MAG: aminotransferase class I/II-fold pyridoxal phosphate-dependent enzyme [Deltaproteobacteria bacterium]|nr:aminotransferase class I/II-fold pyridoxal phosphate-dependent enzyme [Deltaproteobacteria bacterium]